MSQLNSPGCYGTSCTSAEIEIIDRYTMAEVVAQYQAQGLTCQAYYTGEEMSAAMSTGYYSVVAVLIVSSMAFFL